MDMSITIFCMFVIVAYNFLRIAKANKRIESLEKLLDDVAKVATADQTNG